MLEIVINANGQRIKTIPLEDNLTIGKLTPEQQARVQARQELNGTPHVLVTKDKRILLPHGDFSMGERYASLTLISGEV